MRFSLKIFLMIGLALVNTSRVYPGGVPYVPPPPPPPDFPDFPDPPDPPDLPPFSDDPWDIPFDPSDLLDPWEIPPPPEDPWDDPIGDFPEPPPFPEIDDPFPDFPSFIGGDELGYVASPAGLSASARAAGSNVVTKLMPYPQRLPFQPSASGACTVATPRVCNPLNATQLVLPEPNRNTVAFLSTCPWQIVAHVPVGMAPVGVAPTPDDTQGLVANAGDGDTSGTVSLLNLASRTVTKTITFPPSAPDGSPVTPNRIAVSPDGSRAYVASHSCSPGSFIYMVDMATLTVTGSPIPVGCFPASIALTPDGSQLWVSSRGDSRVDVFYTATNKAVTSYQIQLPTGIAFNPTGTRAYIGEGISPGNVVVDTSSYQLITRVPVGNLPHALAVTPAGRYVYVTNGLSNSISQISTLNNKVIRTIKLPNGKQHPLGIGFLQ